MVTSIACRNSSFVAIVLSVMNLSPAFEKEHGLSIVATRMVCIVDDMILSDFLTGNGL